MILYMFPDTSCSWFSHYSHLKLLTEITVQISVMHTSNTTVFHTFSNSTPIETAFISFIPCVSGSTLAAVCNPLGNSSYGMVAPDKNNIGKYTREVTAFTDFTVLHKLAINSPMLNIDTSVNNQETAKTRTFPFISYPKNTTETSATDMADKSAVTPAHNISLPKIHTGLHGVVKKCFNIFLSR